MSEPALPPAPHPSTLPRLVRKSAYGRTQLFLPSHNVTLREIKCMGGVMRRDDASVFHTLPDAWKPSAQPVCCWHCCEPIEDPTTIVPLPRVYDTHAQCYHVYGATCSPGCAKAYVLEHTTFDRGNHLNVLVHMLREVFGVQGPIQETPPRPALRRFGGIFDPRTSCVKATCRLVEPPFVSYCMLVEERLTSHDPKQARPWGEGGGAGGGGEANALPGAPMELEELPTAPGAEVRKAAADLEAPDPPGLFDAFVAERASAAASGGGSANASGGLPGPPPTAPTAMEEEEEDDEEENDAARDEPLQAPPPSRATRGGSTMAPTRLARKRTTPLPPPRPDGPMSKFIKR